MPVVFIVALLHCWTSRGLQFLFSLLKRVRVFSGFEFSFTNFTVSGSRCFYSAAGCAGEEGALECARHVFVYEVPKIMESKLWEWLPKLSAYYSVCKYNCVVIISLKNSQPLDW